jgi:hypothetical protein
MEIVAVIARRISVLRFLLFFGRPFAFPDIPGLNRDLTGGLP